VPHQASLEPAGSRRQSPSFILRRYRFDAEVGDILAGEGVYSALGTLRMTDSMPLMALA